MTNVVEIDMKELLVTPVFMHKNIENVPKSEQSGHEVRELREVAQIRIAGNNNYSPVVPVHAFYRRDGSKTMTYAERWAEQYRRFKEGSPQEAEGTPISMLAKYGITPEEESLCRTMKIYSVEALYALEGANLKSLGMVGNKLKDKARAFMADRASGGDALKQIEELKAQIASLQGNVVPAEEPTPEEMDEALFDAYTEDELRSHIFEKTGVKPDGRLSHASLVNMAKGL
jgi:hypothetical protein